MEMVMEHEKLAKSHGIFYQSWNFTNFVPQFHQICIFVVTAKKLSSNLERLHFLTFSAKCRECKIRKRWLWKIKKWSWKSHGKIFCKSCGNPGACIEIRMTISLFSP